MADLDPIVRGILRFRIDPNQRPNFADPAYAGWQAEFHRLVAGPRYRELGYSRSQRSGRTVLSAWRDWRYARGPGDCRGRRDSIHSRGYGQAERELPKPHEAGPRSQVLHA